MAGTSIDLIASSQPTAVAFAHYDANYLIEETKDVVAAWGGGSLPGSDVNNSALTATGQTQYLYWDIDFRTASLRRGWTTLPPLISNTAPLNPANDQHWFDTANTVMKVFRKTSPSDPGKWIDKIRCFAATYNSSAIIVPYPLGSQVGITGNFFAGQIMIGVNGRALRSGDDKGTFLTTETPLTVVNTGGQNVKFDAALVFAQAVEDIPRFSCVTYVPQKRIKLASSNDINNFVSGIVVEDLHQEEVGQVITNGVVQNDQWPAQPLDGDQGRPLPPLVTDPDYWLIKNHINAPVFCSATGQLMLSPPNVGVVQQVGFVYDVDAVYINLFPPVRLR